MPVEQPGRPNTALAASMEEVLQKVGLCARQQTARLMSARGAPFSVIVRVLAEPNIRRRSCTSSETLKF